MESAYILKNLIGSPRVDAAPYHKPGWIQTEIHASRLGCVDPVLWKSGIYALSGTGFAAAFLLAITA